MFHPGREHGAVHGAAAALLLVLALILASCGGGEYEGAPEVGGETTQETSSAGTYTLPGEAVYPEGITFDESTGDFFVGSTTDGTIFRGNVEGGGEAEVFHRPNVEGRSPAVGMEFVPGGAIDPAGMLLVAGGDTGQIFVYNATNGYSIRSLDTPSSDTTFINDVALVGRDAYFTDSMRPVLFKLPDAPDGDVGEVEAWLDLEGTPIEYGEGFNLNGIAATEDGRYLVTVQSNTGKLFRTDVENKEVVEIDLGGETLENGDGLLLDGRTLYVVCNRQGVIVPVELFEDLSSGEVGEGFTDPSLMYPTTIAGYDGRLLVVNSQFDVRNSGGEPELPFAVSDVEVP